MGEWGYIVSTRCHCSSPSPFTPSPPPSPPLQSPVQLPLKNTTPTAMNSKEESRKTSFSCGSCCGSITKKKCCSFSLSRQGATLHCGPCCSHFFTKPRESCRCVRVCLCVCSRAQSSIVATADAGLPIRGSVLRLAKTVGPLPLLHAPPPHAKQPRDLLPLHLPRLAPRW